MLAALIDGARSCGNYQIHVISPQKYKAMRLVPFGFCLDEEAEQHLLKLILQIPRYFLFLNLFLNYIIFFKHFSWT